MHIVLADDHHLVREGLKAHVLGLANSVHISEAESCADVLALADKSPPPDLILLDLNMPGMSDDGAPPYDGMRGVRAISSVFRNVPVIVVSGYCDAATVARAVRSGARGFVPKTGGSRDLLTTIRRVLAGEVIVPASSAIEPPRVQPQREDVFSFDRVSNREATVLRLLTRGLTNKEIALQLGLKEITVKVHLQHAYRKIGALNRADAVRIILQGVPAEANFSRSVG